MKKAISLLVVFAVCLFGQVVYSESVQNSPNLDAIDTPTTNTLLRGMYNFHLKFYEGGGVLTRAWVGFANIFMIGATFNLDNVIGMGTVTGREPKILAKIKIIEDSPAFPSVALGYEPQSFGVYDPISDKYSIKPIGLYAVVTKNVAPSLFLSAGVGNHNVFKDFKLDTDLDVFANAALMLNPDLGLLVECNDIISKDYLNLSVGIRYAFAPELRIEIDFKGLTKKPEEYIRNLRIDYVNYF